MNIIPVVFAFDNNLSLPAAVCIYSLLKKAKDSTEYHIYILCREEGSLDLRYVRKVMERYNRHKLILRSVGDVFDNTYEIRDITTPAYYRLLIPSLIPEFDRVIYSDVDVIFRQDLSEVYSTSLGNNIIAGVNNLSHFSKDLVSHYRDYLHLNPENTICSGFLVMDTQKMRHENLEEKFIKLSKKNFKFQDQDILNISCSGRIKMLEPKYSVLTYIFAISKNDKEQFLPLWNKEEIVDAIYNGNIHYNGQKPWKGPCHNMDVWWQYYRESPVFDEEFYFDFFTRQLDYLDYLPLWKRIKNVLRYFLIHKK